MKATFLMRHKNGDLAFNVVDVGWIFTRSAIYRGSGTIWRNVVNGKRGSTEVETLLSDEEWYQTHIVEGLI